MQGKKAVTINDVARVAGVSNATVSRYINNKTFVTGEKAEKIERAIEELAYRPNRIARGLKLQRSHADYGGCSRYSEPLLCGYLRNGTAFGER